MRTSALVLLVAVSAAAAPAAVAQDRGPPTAVPEAAAVVPYGGVVLLSGARSSDPDGGIALYTWTRIEGSGGEFPLNRPQATTTPTFVLAQPAGNPFRVGRHRFLLQVTDANGVVSKPAELVFSIVDNIPPVAIGGALVSIYHRQPLELHGEHSADIPGRVVQWSWTRLQGGGNAMPLNQPFVTSSGVFLVPQQSPNGFLEPGQHVFRLVVRDDAGNESAPRDFAVNVISTADTTAPTAVLDAPPTITIGAPLTLSGARSMDVGGTIVRWTWTRLEGGGATAMPLNHPFVTTVNAMTIPQPAGNLLALGRHRYRLTVTDSSGNESSPDERQIMVVDDIRPTAVLDAPREVIQRVAFQLSAARSIDAGGQIHSYRWTRISGSRTGPMALNQMVETTEPVLNIPDSSTNPYALGRQVFRLVVVDDSGNESSPADVAVEIVAKR